MHHDGKSIKNLLRTIILASRPLAMRNLPKYLALSNPVT